MQTGKQGAPAPSNHKQIAVEPRSHRGAYLFGLFWFATVAGTHFWLASKRVPLSFGQSVELLAQRLSIGPYFFDFLPGYLARAVGCFLFMIGLTGVGRGIVSAFHSNHSEDDHGIMHLTSVALGVGLIIAAYFAFFVLAAGWHARFLLVLFWGAVCVLGMLECRRMATSQSRARPPFDASEKTLVYVLACGVLFGMIGSSTPEISYDSLVYHLAIPKTYLDAGRMIDLPYNHYSYLPAITAMLYALALATGGVPLAKMLSLAVGGAVLLSIYSLINRECGRRGALAAAAACATIPLMSYLSFMCNSDLSAIFFLTLALLLCRGWQTTGDVSALHFAGLFCGAALATKYTTAIGVVALLAYVLWTFRNRRPTSPFVAVLVTSILIALPLVPWWARNAAHQGNPFYPYFLDLFGGNLFDKSLMAGWYNETRNRTPGFAIFPHLVKIWRDAVIGFETPPYDYVGPAVLGMLPIALIVNGRKWLGSVCLASWCAYFLGLTATHISRLLLPYVVLMAATGAASLVEATRYRNLFVTMLVLASAHNLYRIGQICLLTSVNGLAILVGGQTASDYLSHHRNWYPNPSYGAFRHIEGDKRFPLDQKVLMIGDPRILYSPRLTIANAPHDIPVIFSWANQSADPEALYRKIRAENIAFIVSNKPESPRTDSPQYVTPRSLLMITALFGKYFEKTYEDEWTAVFSIKQ